MCSEINAELPINTDTEPYSEWRSEPDIPYKIRCNFNSDDGEFAYGGGTLDTRRPASFFLTPDIGTNDHSLSIFFHKSIPKKFLSTVYFHEKTEAACVYGEQHLQLDAAHEIATVKTEKFAKDNLSQSDFEEFKTWQNSLNQPSQNPPYSITEIYDEMCTDIENNHSLKEAREKAAKRAEENREFFKEK